MKHGVIFKINTLIIMLAFSAGLIFFACAFTYKLPKNVTVNGVDVGGKTRAEAAEIIRGQIVENLKTKKLTVYGKRAKYVFAYPEIGFKDNLQTLLKNAVKGGEYTSAVSYYLNGLSEICENICSDESRPVVEPHAIFNRAGEAFTYYEGADGAKADRLKLLNDIRASLKGDFDDVKVTTVKISRNNSLSEVKYNTRLLSTFTTYFDGSNADRAHNIRIAASKINGTVIENGGGFSFNKTVGQRTAERGFRPAKIIDRGEFVEGIGGGVCQVSTTLFNCALLAGCDITEFHPHSLAVSYVPPSFDAMVSGTYFDLKFENLTGYTLYVRAYTAENSITFNIYGRGDGASYGYMSVVKQSVPAPEESTCDPALVKEGRDGTQSEGYLTVTRNGITKSMLFRSDSYAPIKRVVLQPVAQEDNNEIPQ